MNIMYMGTPDFAVPPLKALLENGYKVTAVVTQPDRPKGRGMKLTPPPVKELALENNIPVFQPENLRNGELQDILDEYKPDIILVVAYGKILPEYILNYPKYGCINVHGSLLPKYRGAAPIQRAVINGEKETGVTTMYMAKGLDTGDILLTSKTEITPDETAESLFDRLSVMGAELLIETLKVIESGDITRIPQNDDESSYAATLDKTQARIDWEKSAEEIDCLIRGCYSWPIAHTCCEDLPVKIISAKIGANSNAKPGTVIACDSDGMHVATGNGKAIVVTEFQPSGSKRMSPDAYFRGHKSMIGTVLN